MSGVKRPRDAITGGDSDADRATPSGAGAAALPTPAQPPQGGRRRHHVMRNLMVVVDMSGSTDHGGQRASGVHTRDLLPDRLTNIVENCYAFVDAYFEECPLGHLGLVVTREGRAEKLSRLQVGSANLKRVIDTSIRTTCGSGTATLQNSLEMCLRELQRQPAVATREVLVIWASNSSTDPGDVFETFAKLKEERIHCSIVGIGGQVRVLQILAEATGGHYRVPANETHFRDLIMGHADAPTLDAKNAQASKPGFISMGFPRRSQGSYAVADDYSAVQANCYACPRCGTAAAALPAMCGTCGMTLLASSHVARSFYSLFPPTEMHPVSVAGGGGGGGGPTQAGLVGGDGGAADTVPPETPCAGCGAQVGLGGAEEGHPRRCSKCASVLCSGCHRFVAGKLHLCPGCVTG